MPPSRNNIREIVKGKQFNNPFTANTKIRTDVNQGTVGASIKMSTTDTIYPGCVEHDSSVIHYPVGDTERHAFRTSGGKKVTMHQWAVYDYTLRIPLGQVVTYKAVCDAIGQGSPRSVGSALKNNPFAPYVPCHRVIASTLYLGGYCGEWGPEAKTGTQFNRKLKILTDEGVKFDSRGMLKSSQSLRLPQ